MTEASNTVPAVPMSPFRVAGDLMFLSGQLPFQADGTFANGIEAQTQQCLENIKKIIEAEGADISQILKVTTWLVNKSDFAAYNNVYRDFFGDVTFPARSTVVSELALNGALIEIEAIVHRG